MAEAPSPPLFIAGAPRSGTSLLRNLVRACDDIYLPPDETQFLPAYLNLVARNPSTDSLVSFLNSTPFSKHMRRRGIWPSQTELKEILVDPAPSSAVPELMKYLARKEGGASFTFWGDKTPTYVYSLNRFREIFPNMRVLFIFRDPRDTVLSMREAWGRSLIQGATVWRDVAKIARLYEQSNGSSATMVTNYESLATNPAAVMTEIARFLGVEFRTDTLDNYEGEEKWGAARDSGVVNTSIGRHRTELSAAEVTFIERITFDEMKLCGYEPEYAAESHKPTAIRLKCAEIADSLRSLTRYMKEQGIRDGLNYKIRQYVVARRGRRY